MTSSLGLLLTLIALGALVLIAHVAVLIQALRTKIAWKYRWLAFVPPFAPILAWKGGNRAAPAIWLLLVIAYGAARAAEATIVG